MAAEHGYKKPSRAGRPEGLPTYQEVLVEFERRTSVKPKPAQLPAPDEVFGEFERRTERRFRDG